LISSHLQASNDNTIISFTAVLLMYRHFIYMHIGLVISFSCHRILMDFHYHVCHFLSQLILPYLENSNSLTQVKSLLRLCAKATLLQYNHLLSLMTSSVVSPVVLSDIIHSIINTDCIASITFRKTSRSTGVHYQSQVSRCWTSGGFKHYKK